MSRSSWVVLCGLIGFLFCVSFFTVVLGVGREQGSLGLALTAGVGNAVGWGVLLLPLFLVGAWVGRLSRRRKDV